MSSPGDLRDVFLNPGGFHFGGGQVRIHTLLGSCISITLWHPRRHIGGMCHYMLPERGRKHPATTLDGRYADEAMALFDREIARAGTRPEDYEAKIFGGGNMFGGARPSPGTQIGQRNLQVAHTLLAARGIRIAAEHHGGQGHRKLIFELWSGQAWLAFRQTSSSDPDKSSP